MNATDQTHPSREELTSYLAGKLNAVESDNVKQHLAACDTCCDVLDSLPTDDTIVAALRQQEADTSVSAEADSADIIAPTITPEADDGTQAVHGQSTKVAGLDADQLNLPSELREHPRYRIVELLGHGGMGDVYRAEHKVMSRHVALKVIKPQLVQNDAAVRRFQREVKAAAQLRHSNIVTAFDAEQAGDLHYLVMEFVDGEDLDEVIRRDGPLPVEDACNYIRQAAEGLQHANDLGMVHRDIKPHNLMIEVGRASSLPGSSIGKQDAYPTLKILDFGLANFATETAEEELAGAGDVDKPVEQSAESTAPGASILHQLTQMGTMMGTPDYIAPEQAKDAHTADIRADIYSLGCTFYTLLSGKAPFSEGSVLDKVKAHSHEEAPPLADFRDDVPEEVEAVLQKMMAKNPDERYQTPAEVAEALSAVGRIANPSMCADGRIANPSYRRRRPLVLAAVATLFLALLVAAATIFYIQTDPSKEVEPAGTAQPLQDLFDEQGRPHLSWRVHILPYLDQRELYDKFQLDEPWDSEHNKPLLEEMPEVYKTTDDLAKTTLLSVVGEGTAYEGKQGFQFRDLTDGTSNTALVVDAGQEKAVPWTKPEDLPFDSEDPIRAVGTSDFGDVFLALMADTSVQSIPYDTAPESLRALFTRAAGDSFDENAKRTTPLPESVWSRGNADEITLDRKFGGRVPVKELEFFSETHALAVAAGTTTGALPELHVWDLEAGRVQVAIPLPFHVRTAAVSGDHKFVLVAENKQGPGARRVARFNLDVLRLSPEELAEQAEKVWVQSLIPPNRKSYEILQLKLEPAWTISLEQSTEELQCLLNDEAFLVRDHRGRVALYRSEDGGFVSELAAAKVEAMSLAPDGKLLMVKYDQGGGHLLRADDGFKVNELKIAATSRVTATDWCADGRCVITADAAGQISVWNLATGEAVHSFSTGGEPITNVLIDSNRERIYSSSEHGVAVWDLAGQLLARGEAPPFAETSLALSPDRKTLLSGGQSWQMDGGASSDDHSLRLWQLPESTWPEEEEE